MLTVDQVPDLGRGMMHKLRKVSSQRTQPDFTLVSISEPLALEVAPTDHCASHSPVLPISCFTSGSLVNVQWSARGWSKGYKGRLQYHLLVAL